MENDIQKTVAEYVEIFFKRKKFFFVPFFSVLALAIIAYPFIPRSYESNSLLLMDDNKIINPLIEGLAVKAPADKKLKSLTTQILSWSSMVDLIQKVNLSDRAADQKSFERLISSMRDRIKIRLVTDEIVKISYVDRNPMMARNITRAITENLVERNRNEKKMEAESAIEFISGQLGVYKNKLSSSEKTFFSNKVNADLEEAYKKQNVLREQLSQMERDMNRDNNPVLLSMRKEYLQAEFLLKQMEQNSKEDSPIIKELRGKIESMKQRIKLEEDSRVYTDIQDANPVYQAIQSQLKELELSINSLERRKTELLHGQFSLGNVSEQELIGMERDKKVNEDIYQSLLRRLENAHISQQLGDGQSSGFKIIDPAILPLYPATPNPLVFFLGGFMLAFATGLGAIILNEYFDTSFRGGDDAKSFLKIPLLASVPRVLTLQEAKAKKLLSEVEHPPIRQGWYSRVLARWRKDLKVEPAYIARISRHEDISPYVTAFHDPGSVTSEQFRLFRTRLLQAQKNRPLQTIMMTSSVAGEGKTTTSINLAVSMATELNRKVLLLDCDLRKGSVGKNIGLSHCGGLSEFLNGSLSMESLVQESQIIEGLSVIPSGAPIQNPSRVLLSSKMPALIDYLRNRFDFIIMDAPPVLNLADVPMLVNYADAMVLVVESGQTRREHVQSTLRVLEQYKESRLLGFVLTRVQHHVPSYIYQYIAIGV